jgi:hypothetical protein
MCPGIVWIESVFDNLLQGDSHGIVLNNSEKKFLGQFVRPISSKLPKLLDFTTHDQSPTIKCIAFFTSAHVTTAVQI